MYVCMYYSPCNTYEPTTAASNSHILYIAGHSFHFFAFLGFLPHPEEMSTLNFLIFSYIASKDFW